MMKSRGPGNEPCGTPEVTVERKIKGKIRRVRLKVNELSSALEVGFELVHGSVGDASGGESI